MIHIDNKKTTIDTSDSITPKLIFIVPYRDREQQLIFFKRHIEYILEDYEKEEYDILYIHQTDKRSFNCGAMKNIGFLIVKNKYPNDYKNITLVFNDVDTMPFSKNFLQYETEIGTVKHFYGFTYTLGGIVSITGYDFERINGFPNFWAWGYEDNLLLERVTQAKINIDRSTFFPFADKNILHFYDGYVKQVNKNEFQRYNNRTREGIHSIFKLVYHKNNNTGLMDITSFETGTDEHKQSTRMHDLRNSTTPFTGARSNRRSTMSLLL
jgi:hypothetical protein